MQDLGTKLPGAVIYLKFNTSATLTAGAIAVYKGNSTTEKVETGLTVTFDGVAGLNHLRFDTGADRAFYALGEIYYVVLSAGTVSGISVAGVILAKFDTIPVPADVRQYGGRDGEFSDGLPTMNLGKVLGKKHLAIRLAAIAINFDGDQVDQVEADLDATLSQATAAAASAATAAAQATEAASEAGQANDQLGEQSDDLQDLGQAIEQIDVPTIEQIAEAVSGGDVTIEEKDVQIGD